MARNTPPSQRAAEAGASAPAGDGADESAPPALFTWLAFALTLVLVVARALMSETLREPFDVVAGGDALPRGPGAATSLTLDALCCLPALLVLLRRAIDRTYVLRWGWSHVLLGLLAAWATLSFAWSSDRFTTAVSAANTVAAAALVWSTAQLVRSWLRLRIVAGVCLGLLLAYTANGLIYRYVQVPDNIAFWRDHKVEMLAAHNIEPDSFQARQLERKFVGGEMIGFNQSPNSFAAVIVLLAVVSAGIAIQRKAGGDGIAWPLAIAIACAPALLVLSFTHSRTAFGTLTIAAVALAALASSRRLRDLLAARSRVVYATGATIVLLGAIALVGHGVHHGSLPHDSLNFRWRYWVAASTLAAQHPFTGVGWGNFGPHYLSVRAPAAAEEVRDPHNFLVRGLAELGVLGGILIAAWMARTLWELTRPIAPPAPAAAPANGSTERSLANAAVPIIALVAVCGVALNAAFAIDWSQSPAYVQLEVFYRVMYLGLVCAGLVLATIRPDHARRIDDRAAPWLLYGCVVAVGVFFVHAMMDFVLAEAGPLMLFAVVLGAGLGVRSPRSTVAAPGRRGLAIGAVAVGAIAWCVAVFALVIPVADAEQSAQAADDSVRKRAPAAAAATLEAAFRAVPWNADYAFRAARALMLAGAEPQRVKAMLDVAIATDPASVMYLQTRAAYEMQLPSPDAAAVRADYERVLKLDPNNVPARLDYAAALERFNDRAASAAQYREALRLDGLLDKTEPERLPREKLAEIEGKIERLKG